jgi:hypothetical protein
MIGSDKVAIFTITFTVACAAIYTVCTEINLPLLTYHPVTGEIDALWTPERRGPAMYWYGWMLTAAVAALVPATLATVVPEQWLQRAFAFACLSAAGYLVLYTLALFVYDKATVELEFLKSRALSAGAALLVAALLTLLMPTTWTRRLWPGWSWVVPLGALCVLGYYLVPYFTR